MNTIRRSIRDRVRTLILAVSLTVLAMTTTAFVIYEVLSFKSQLVRDVKTVTAIIAENVAPALVFDDPGTAKKILAGLGVEPDAERCAVYDANGHLYAIFPQDSSTNLVPPSPIPTTNYIQGSSLIVTGRLIEKGRVCGAIYMQWSLRGMYERLWRYAFIALCVLLASFVSAYILSSVLQGRISEPIVALTRAAQTISQRQDYSIRVPKLTDDELGVLTDSFNTMVVRTQDHQNRLSEQARLLDLSHDAISVRDMDNRLSYWNQGCFELYGYTREEALGKTLGDLLHTEYPEDLAEIRTRLLRDNRWNGELVQTCKDGHKIYVASRWSLVRDPLGRPQSVLESNTDISERKAFQQNLERLVQERTAKLQETIGELEAFSYSVSHDMRAPLRAMQGYAKALLADYKERLDDEAIHYLERISRVSNRLDLLIQDVLAYSKVAKGEIALTPVNLERLIEDLLPSHPEFQPPQAQIIIDSPLPLVLGHEAYLTQCVTNLLGNAVKFVAPGVTPTVRIRAETIGDQAKFWFEDNGIGIDPSHQERIFQIFGQVYGEKKYGGTGIGLAIVRKAVQRMNGEVGVESELGRGSRFWITLRKA